MTTIGRAGLDIDHLVSEGVDRFRVHGSCYTDQDIFERELDIIFTQGWVYVGHESEIPRPGDYRLTSIATEAVIMCRDEKGGVQLLMNRCTHRANAVCQAERGNATFFRCAYHGWTFRNSGELVGMTYSEAFPDSFRKEDMGLAKVPRVSSYRGFIFGSLAENGITLDEHLGDLAKEQIDRFCNQSPLGEIEVRAGTHKYGYKANWKFQCENSQDFYHVNFTHQAAFVGRGQQRRPVEFQNIMRYLGRGHASVDLPYEIRHNAGNHIPASAPGGSASSLSASREQYVQQMNEAYGPENAAQIIGRGGPHMLIFPNLILLGVQIRVIRPLKYDETEVFLYPALLKGVPDEINTLRLRGHEGFYGPAGGGAPDDLEMFSRNQVGLSATVNPWLVLERGINRELPDPDGGTSSEIRDEIAQRGFWRHWKEVMGHD